MVRVAYGSDINPLSAMLTEPRLCPPALQPSRRASEASQTCRMDMPYTLRQQAPKRARPGMTTEELLKIIATGEDSKRQFKSDVANADSLGAEMVAFSNAGGGMILIGVDDDGGISGLDARKVAKINQLVSNAATHKVRPPIAPATENIALPEGLVMAVTVEPGPSKPYQDAQGYFWTKSGADKRRVTAREELQRMFQESHLVYGDDTPVRESSITDLDRKAFAAFFERHKGEPLSTQETPVEQLLENMKLMKDGHLTVAGALLFAENPEYLLPVFIVKAVSFPGTEIIDVNYIDSQDLGGRLAEVFRQSIRFVLSNIHHRQNGQNFNSLGVPEVPRLVLDELMANALIHRDYFVSAPIRVLVFADRIEIISPGHLPNNLTVDNIKLGHSNIRNRALASYAPQALPYRGLGSGILRALNAYPDIDFVDDRDGNVFKAVIRRQAVP